MFRAFLKIACLTFACVVLSYIAAMAQYGTHGYLGLHDYIGSAHAQDMTAAPEKTDAQDEAVRPVTKNGINYITGGIGDEERDAFESCKGDYNFHLTLSSRDGSYTGDAGLSIAKADNVILPETDAGPLFYANLNPGTYRISVSRDGKIRQMTVVIGRAKPLYLSMSL